MNALGRAYDNTTDADRSVEALLAAGVPGDDAGVLMGAEAHDARRESGGGVAGAVASDARVGDFADRAATSAALREAASPGTTQRARKACSPMPIATSS